MSKSHGGKGNKTEFILSSTDNEFQKLYIQLNI